MSCESYNVLAVNISIIVNNCIFRFHHIFLVKVWVPRILVNSIFKGNNKRKYARNTWQTEIIIVSTKSSDANMATCTHKPNSCSVPLYIWAFFPFHWPALLIIDKRKTCNTIQHDFTINELSKYQRASRNVPQRKYPFGTSLGMGKLGVGKQVIHKPSVVQ